MHGIALRFIVTAVLLVFVGMAHGIYMATTTEFATKGAHAHLNLLGFVSMMLFGLYYHAVPSAAASVLARLHFVWHLLTVILMYVGIILVVRQINDAVVAIASLAAVGSMLIFLIIVLRHRS